MLDDHRDQQPRIESLESRVQGKLASAVRRGADGKGPGDRDLAGGLPDSDRGVGRRLPIPTGPSRRGARTYGAQTIAAALAGATEFCTPGATAAIVRPDGIRTRPAGGIALPTKPASRLAQWR